MDPKQITLDLTRGGPVGGESYLASGTCPSGALTVPNSSSQQSHKVRALEHEPGQLKIGAETMDSGIPAVLPERTRPRVRDAGPRPPLLSVPLTLYTGSAAQPRFPAPILIQNRVGSSARLQRPQYNRRVGIPFMPSFRPMTGSPRGVVPIVRAPSAEPPRVLVYGRPPKIKIITDEITLSSDTDEDSESGDCGDSGIDGSKNALFSIEPDQLDQPLFNIIKFLSPSGGANLDSEIECHIFPDVDNESPAEMLDQMGDMTTHDKKLGPEIENNGFSQMAVACTTQAGSNPHLKIYDVETVSPEIGIEYDSLTSPHADRPLDHEDSSASSSPAQNEKEGLIGTDVIYGHVLSGVISVHGAGPVAATIGQLPKSGARNDRARLAQGKAHHWKRLTHSNGKWSMQARRPRKCNKCALRFANCSQLLAHKAKQHFRENRTHAIPLIVPLDWETEAMKTEISSRVIQIATANDGSTFQLPSYNQTLFQAEGMLPQFVVGVGPQCDESRLATTPPFSEVEVELRKIESIFSRKKSKDNKEQVGVRFHTDEIKNCSLNSNQLDTGSEVQRMNGILLCPTGSSANPSSPSYPSTLIGIKSDIVFHPVNGKSNNERPSLEQVPEKEIINTSDQSGTKTESAQRQQVKNLDSKTYNRDQITVVKMRKTGTTGYKCGICNQILTERANATRHLRIHSNDKLFTCKQCQKTFSRSDALKTHERSHGAVKLIKCNACEEHFTTLDHQRRHIRKFHSGKNSNSTAELSPSKPYACTDCPMRYKFRVRLLNHITTVHTSASTTPTPTLKGPEAKSRRTGRTPKRETPGKKCSLTSVGSQQPRHDRRNAVECIKIEMTKTNSGIIQFQCATCHDIFDDFEKANAHISE